MASWWPWIRCVTRCSPGCDVRQVDANQQDLQNQISGSVEGCDYGSSIFHISLMSSSFILTLQVMVWICFKSYLISHVVGNVGLLIVQNEFPSIQTVLKPPTSPKPNLTIFRWHFSFPLSLGKFWKQVVWRIFKELGNHLGLLVFILSILMVTNFQSWLQIATPQNRGSSPRPFGGNTLEAGEGLSQGDCLEGGPLMKSEVRVWNVFFLSFVGR